MATPTVESVLTGTDTDATSVTITYPSTTSAGATIVLIVGGRNNTTFTTSETGFNALAAAGGTQTSMRVFWKKAAGTEAGNTFTLSGTLADDATWVIYSITDADDPTTNAPEVEYSFVDTDQADSDPPIITPTGGSADYLYLTATFKRDNAAYTANPTSGTPAHTNFIYQAGSAADLGTTRLATTASTSENPSVYTSDVADNTACTIAIYPAGGGGGPTVGTTTLTLLGVG